MSGFHQQILHYLRETLDSSTFSLSAAAYRHNIAHYNRKTREIYVLQQENRLFLWVFSLDFQENASFLRLSHRKYALFLRETEEIPEESPYKLLISEKNSPNFLAIANDSRIFGKFPRFSLKIAFFLGKSRENTSKIRRKSRFAVFSRGEVR